MQDRIFSKQIDEIQNIQDALQSRSTLKGCMEKLKADDILIKCYRVWDSNMYEGKGAWILEQLFDSYNETIDKFEKKL